MIDIKKAERTFKDYLNHFDLKDEKIKLKIIHTFSVMKVSNLIAGDLNLDRLDIELGRLIALLHDIGRFEQINQENTFSDNHINHAELRSKNLI